MALARIITRSDTCSRELAFDLLGRGYAVEVVTPDSIPSHRADLELRVETGTGDRLTASVIARDGERSASLEFVRELKGPDSDPASTPSALETDLVARSTSAEAESSFKTVEVPAETSAVPSAVRPTEITLSPAPEPIPQIKQDLVPEIKPEIKEDIEAVKDALQPVGAEAQEVMPNPLPSLAEEPPGNFASASSMIMRPTAPAPAAALHGRVQPTAKGLRDLPPHLMIKSPKAQPPVLSRPFRAAAEVPKDVDVPPPLESRSFEPRGPEPRNPEPQSFDSQSYKRPNYDRSPGLLLTVGVTLTSMALLLTLVFGLSVRRRTPSPIPAVADRVAPSGAGASAAHGTNLPSSVVPTADSGNRPAPVSPSPDSAPAPKSEARPAAPAAKASSITKVKNGARKASPATALANSSHVRGDQLIARDTVTYLNRPKAAVPQKSSVGLNANDRRVGVVAENTVTNLNGASGNAIQLAPKAAK
jgi:hypothetical protein